MRTLNALAALAALLSLIATMLCVPYTALLLVVSVGVFVMTERRLPMIVKRNDYEV